MLITVPRWQVALAGSPLFLAVSGGLLCVVPDLARDLGRSTATAVIGGLQILVIVAIFTMVLSGFRLVRVRGDRVTARNLFETRAVSATTCAFGISVSFSGRGMTTYTVYVADRAARAEICDCLSASGAERARSRLERCFCQDGRTAQRRTAQAQVDRAQQRWQTDFAVAKGQVDAYYAAGSHRRASCLILAGVALCLLVMAIVMWLTSTPL